MVGDIVDVYTVKQHSAMDLSAEVLATVVAEQAKGNKCEVQYHPLLDSKDKVIYTALVIVR